MGYELRYRNLKIVKYSQTPSGRKLKNKYVIISNDMLISSVNGLTLTQAKKQLQYYKKVKKYVFR